MFFKSVTFKTEIHSLDLVNADSLSISLSLVNRESQASRSIPLERFDSYQKVLVNFSFFA